MLNSNVSTASAGPAAPDGRGDETAVETPLSLNSSTNNVTSDDELRSFSSGADVLDVGGWPAVF